MRRLKTGLTSLFLLVLTGAIALAQEESNTQAYWVHEDVVKPSKVGDYESICKELTDNLKKHNIQEISTAIYGYHLSQIWQRLTSLFSQHLGKKWDHKPFPIYLTEWMNVMMLNRIMSYI